MVKFIPLFSFRIFLFSVLCWITAADCEIFSWVILAAFALTVDLKTVAMFCYSENRNLSLNSDIGLLLSYTEGLSGAIEVMVVRYYINIIETFPNFHHLKSHLLS